MSVYFSQIHRASDATILARRALRAGEYTNFADLVFAVSEHPDLFKGIEAEQIAEALPRLALSSFPDFRRTFEIWENLSQNNQPLMAAARKLSIVAGADEDEGISRTAFTHRAAKAINNGHDYFESKKEYLPEFEAGARQLVANLATSASSKFLRLLSGAVSEDYISSRLIGEKSLGQHTLCEKFVGGFVTPNHITDYLDANEKNAWHETLGAGALVKSLKDKSDLLAGISEKRCFHLAKGYAAAENYLELDELAAVIRTDTRAFSAFKAGVVYGPETVAKYKRDHARSVLKAHCHGARELWGVVDFANAATIASKYMPQPT